jgi:magnesium chelatase subunit H
MPKMASEIGRGCTDTVSSSSLVGARLYSSLTPRRICAPSLYTLLTERLERPARRRYGFPPGVGATGTAALLNVPKSVEALLRRLQEQGYDLGEGGIPDGEALVAALSQLDDERATNLGARGLEAEFNQVAASLQKKESESSPLGGLQSGSSAVSPSQLKQWLTFPETWGPTEWGPIPYLPDNTLLVDRMERQWGDVGSYRGIKSAADGSLVVPGLQLGNVWIGVQVNFSPYISDRIKCKTGWSPWGEVAWNKKLAENGGCGVECVWCSRCWAWRATPCACCSSATSPRTRSTPPSTSGCRTTYR